MLHMDSFNTPSPPRKSNILKRRPIVTQQWLEEIETLEELSKDSLERARKERAEVLKAIDAGAPVEPGRLKVRIRTRWRRRKAS